MMRMIYGILMIITITIGSLLVSNIAHAQTFTDVPENAEYYQAVEVLVELEAVNPKLDQYNPGNNITRGQAAKIIAIALGLYDPNAQLPEQSKFSDVSATHEFYPYIVALSERGIINGRPDGTFGLNDSLTRGQMAKIIINSLGVEAFEPSYLPYIDVQIGVGFGDYIATMYLYGLAAEAEKYSPNSTVKRSQLALFVHRAITKSKGIHSSEILKLKEIQFNINIENEAYALYHVSNEGKVLSVIPSANESEFDYLLTPHSAGESYILLGYNKFTEYDFERTDDLQKNIALRVNVVDKGSHFEMSYERVFEIPETHRYVPTFIYGYQLDSVFSVDVELPNGSSRVVDIKAGNYFYANLLYDGIYHATVRVDRKIYDDVYFSRKPSWFGYELVMYQPLENVHYSYDLNDKYTLTVDNKDAKIIDDGKGNYEVVIEKAGKYVLTFQYQDGEKFEDSFEVVEYKGKLLISMM